MSLSIIIVNFNTPELTLACIESIKKQSFRAEFEIILIDNAPVKDFKNHFLCCYPTLQYILSPDNIGFGKANNLGMERANGDYFLLLNSDTIVIDDCFERCINFMEEKTSQHIGLIGCRLLNEDGTYQASFYPYTVNNVWNYFKSNNPILYKFFNIQKDFMEIKETRKVGDISGAFMFLRKSVYEKVNGFDPDFFLYCEETDWCRNRIARHFDIYYFPQAEIIHLGGKSAPKPLMYLQSHLSLALFWYKKSWGSYLIYILVSWINGLYYTISYPISSSQSKGRIRQYLNALCKTLPYLLFEIPKYGRKFGARKEGLILEEAREVFFKKIIN